MNRKLIIVIVLFIVAAIVIVVISKDTYNKKPADGSLWEDYKIVTKTIEGKKLRLVVADTPQHHEYGLMLVRKPVHGFDGMIFIFPEKEIRHFWNMNTYEDLTLYWMDDDIIVGKSEMPSIEKSKDIFSVSSPEPANIVVEVIK